MKKYILERGRVHRPFSPSFSSIVFIPGKQVNIIPTWSVGEPRIFDIGPHIFRTGGSQDLCADET